MVQLEGNALSDESSQLSIQPFGVTAPGALAIVGLTAQAILEIAAREMMQGNAYLVGSLASGLGNLKSDVDIHVIRPELSATTGPHVYFVNNVMVDVECYPARWATEVKERARNMTTADTPIGRISLDTRLRRKACRWVARWLHAVPLDDATPRIFDARESSGILPILVRDAYDALIALIAAARLAEGADAAARSYLWRQASRRLLEVQCRAAGDVTTSPKWLASRARRLGLSNSYEAENENSFRRMAERCDFPAIDEWEVTRVQLAAGAETIQLAGRQRLVNRHNRVLDDWCTTEGKVADLVSEFGCKRLLEALRRAELDLMIDNDSLRRDLDRWISPQVTVPATKAPTSRG
ncbi:hypothetical protein ACIBK9_28690 [Nonomuraea sp. NPDC050227]|uniref:hypothetical protein n=1 Tax=Nonomuraea sp. NPDC050227 TaxID=3364360 RepID=UPI0037982888